MRRQLKRNQRSGKTRFRDGESLRFLRRNLLAWFRQSARDLPWRRTRDPYAIWVSEIMLQQTQVVTVVPYFQRFLQRFPTITALARASEQDVLKMWEGLGYYRRARQLHRAARMIVEQHHGQFPQDMAIVLTLPGIGRYTAGAILSIAFHQRQPILEANTIRVLSRLSAYRGDPTTGAGQRDLWNLAERLLPRKNAGTFNQALMELGSEICTPRDPLCDHCPVQQCCPTKELGLQHCIPQPKKRITYENIREAAVIIERNGKLLLRRCGQNERWAGMWDFPRYGVQAQRDPALQHELARHVAESTGLKVRLGPRWKTIKHGVTRFRITLDCYKVVDARGRTVRNGYTLRWLKPNELDRYPLSVTGRKICQMWSAERQRGGHNGPCLTST